jgi:hypothetical protein
MLSMVLAHYVAAKELAVKMRAGEATLGAGAYVINERVEVRNWHGSAYVQRRGSVGWSH